MKTLDSALKLVLIGAVLWWAANLPIGRLAAQSAPAAPDLGALIRKLDAAIARNDAAVAKAEAAIGRLESGSKPPPKPAPTPGDAAARDLGANYRAAILAAHLAALEAVAKASDAGSMAELVAAQAKAATDGRKRAAAPILAELTRRFGDPDEGGDVAGARTFYQELATGYREGK